MASLAALEAALTLHRSSIESFLSSAEAVPEALWRVPVAPGKWSPGQITEHLSLSLEAVAREVRGILDAVPLPWWERLVARRRYLPGMLEEKRFLRARAPRGLGPQTASASGEALARCARQAPGRAGLPRPAGSRSACATTSARFGAGFFAVNALHVLHHRSQLPLS
jgi:hypothetical protein